MTHEPDCIIVFEAARGRLRIPFLKKEFAHCFSILKSEGQWVAVNSLLTGFEVSVIGYGDLESISCKLQKHEYLHMIGHLRAGLRGNLSCRLLTCVEITKRIAGIADWSIVTPFQLYKHLASRADFLEVRP